MWELDWQVPQAPVPALPQGPQELPQQNQVLSPAQRLVDPQAMSGSSRLRVGWGGGEKMSRA
jgi:hypothetical protein